MSGKRKALLAGAALCGLLLAFLFLRPGESPAEEGTALASLAPAVLPSAPASLAAPPQPAPARSPSIGPPVFDLVRVEKEEVCEGEENLVTVHAHTDDGNDAFLHYTVAGEAGAAVPVKAYVGRDGKSPQQYAVAFSRNNVPTRVPLPSWRVKNCRPARILAVTMRMLPNAVGEREFTAIVQTLQGDPFTAAWFDWSFGDGAFDATAGPIAVHDYSRLPQRTAFTDLLVKVKALDGSGQSVEGRYPLHIRNVAFDTRSRGMATIFAEPSPRFAALGPDGIVRQKFRLWHAEDVSVQITGATMARLFVPQGPGSAPRRPERVAIDPARLLQFEQIPPATAVEQALEYDFGANPETYGVVYQVQGLTAAGMQASGEITLLRPPPRPTPENSVPVSDPAMILKIRRAMAILKQETVSQEDLFRLEREGKLQ